MPSIKEKCVCQICICGRHHCGEEIKFPTLIEESESEEVNEKNKPTDNKNVIGFDTNQHKTNQEPSTSQGKASGKNSEQTSSNGQRVYFKVEKKKVTNYEKVSNDEMSDLDENVSIGGTTNQQRKQWQTSPNEVEQLTRSLSRLRTDLDIGVHYEKFTEKEHNSKMQHKCKSKAVKYNQPYLIDSFDNNSKHLASRMNQLNKDSSTESSFLPPLTGFSDSDSSFGSFSCFDDEKCKNQMHCICETIKDCNLNNGNNCKNGINSSINYIDSDQWVVTKPQRMRPKDNLRLDGQMDLNTTFRSTYDETAKKIVPTDSDESKRSSRASNSQALYLGTKQGRNGHTPILRSARRRRARNRPQTSLKLGGDGYYHTINQDSYKNFVIVDGQAKMIQNNNGERQSIKLPRMIQKKRSFKNPVKLRGKGSEEERNIIRIGEDEIEKIEKKSLKILNNDISGVESDVEKLKMIHVVKRSAKKNKHNEDKSLPEQEMISKDAQTDSDDLQINEGTSTEEKQIENWTIDNQASSSMRKQFASHRYQDHIKEMGLLERNENEPIKVNQERKHMRKLHETSTRIILPDRVSPPLKPEPKQMVEKEKVKEIIDNHQSSPVQKTMKTFPKHMNEKFVDGHVVDKCHPKPFIIPQRIHCNKNQSSVNLFNGEMDFVTTNRQAFGNGTRGRLGSGKRRVPTAGKRVLRSARRRNLFRQSSDSMFSNMDPVNFIKKPPIEQSKIGDDLSSRTKSVYNQEFGDHLYCPALDVSNAKSNENFKFTGEAGGHKYYLSTQYEK